MLLDQYFKNELLGFNINNLKDWLQKNGESIENIKKKPIKLDT
jgi:hypothetical protein